MAIRGLVGSTGLRTILLVGLLTACSREAPTAPDEGIGLRSEDPAVAALVTRLNIARPRVPPDVKVAWAWSFDREGRVTSSRPLTAVEKAEMGRIPREHLRRTRSSWSPPNLAPADTTATFELGGITYTVEGAGSTGLGVVAIAAPGDVPRLASWDYFSESGDTTTFSSMTHQLYDDEGYLQEEMYLSSGDLAEFNEEIVPEMAPPGPMAEGNLCAAARMAMFSLGGGALLRFVKWWWFSKSIDDFIDGVLLTAGFIGAVHVYLCECKNNCAETAPPGGVGLAGMYQESVGLKAWNSIMPSRICPSLGIAPAKASL